MVLIDQAREIQRDAQVRLVESAARRALNPLSPQTITVRRRVGLVLKLLRDNGTLGY